MANAVLNEREIIRRLVEGDLVITPLLDPVRQIGATSVDIRLGFEFEGFNITKHTHLDPTQKEEDLKSIVEDYTTKVHLEPMQPLILHPGEFILAATLEYLRVPTDLAGRLEGRSSWGRLGLQVHSTAGFVDPGFEGMLTFELQNMGKGPLCLYPGVRIAQLCLFRTSRTAIPYTKKKEAKYFHKIGTTGSLFYEEKEFRAIRDFVTRQ
ncbi:MAG: dCTP deaminase [Candidatus Hydrogenedentes bacterium]|nr:dCTP deaminase [Candidatus Hydrogenedentota bacterium]